jgi:hypothetical protein
MRWRGADCLVVALKRCNGRGAKGAGHRRWVGSTGNGRSPTINGRRQPSCGGTSRMNREVHVRFCEGLGVKFPGPTRHSDLDALTMVMLLLANRRSWMWGDETVRFSVSGRNPGCDRAIERMRSKDRCTRRNPHELRTVSKPEISMSQSVAGAGSPFQCAAALSETWRLASALRAA